MEDQITDDEVGRRISAARQIAGMKRPADLSAAIGGGLGERSLYRREQGKQHATPRDLLAIAHATGLPVTFFTAPRSALGPEEAPREAWSPQQEAAAAAAERVRGDAPPRDRTRPA